MGHKILFYDIETSLSKALMFRLGKQVVRHTQLMPANQITDIITIQYCFNDDKPGKAIALKPYDKEEYQKNLQKFDEIIKQADIVVGKNNKRFDDKHINTNRLLNPNAPAMPEWMLHKSEDLEQYIRRNFNLLSYSLDYVSELLGLGGKNSMSFYDWRCIYSYYELLKLEKVQKVDSGMCEVLYNQTKKEVIKEGKAAEKRMIEYGIKDVEDTRTIWNYCVRHFQPAKINYSGMSEKLCCKTCKSLDIRKNGSYTSNRGAKYIQFFCKEHNGYAGKCLESQYEKLKQNTKLN